jgi:hypothetical protein
MNDGKSKVRLRLVAYTAKLGVRLPHLVLTVSDVSCDVVALAAYDWPDVAQASAARDSIKVGSAAGSTFSQVQPLRSTQIWETADTTSIPPT